MTVQHVVTLGGGRKVTVGQYAQAWRRVLASAPGASFDRSLCERWSATREEILREFREGLADRINRHIPGYGVGRKWSYDWQMDAWRTSRAVNTPRLIVRWIPKDLRARLAHRIYREED